MKKCLFIGSKKIGLRALKKVYEINPESLVGCVTFDDRSDCRSEFDNIRLFCNEKGINVIVLDKPSNLRRVVEDFSPELCLVVGWYWLIDNYTINHCNGNVIGVHASLLPRYRGFAPLVWAMINGESKTGVTLFYIREGIDSGNIIAQKEIHIMEEDYISDLLSKVEDITLEILEENYFSIISEEIISIEQNESEASYCSIRYPSDGLINWRNSNKDVYNFIRAQSNPYPGAYIYINNTKIIIEKSKIFPNEYYGIPGRILKVEAQRILVSCKNSAIYIYPQLEEEKIKNFFKFGNIIE